MVAIDTSRTEILLQWMYPLFLSHFLSCCQYQFSLPQQSNNLVFSVILPCLPLKVDKVVWHWISDHVVDRVIRVDMCNKGQRTFVGGKFLSHLCPLESSTVSNHSGISLLWSTIWVVVQLHSSNTLEVEKGNASLHNTHHYVR